MSGFRDDECARVPLVVVGVLFLLISAAVSINITRMDGQMAAAITVKDDGAGTALLYARADLARAVNYAGMEALKQMGETPVVQLDNSSQYNTGGSDVAHFNRNWAKGMINNTLDQFIRSNYMHDSYNYRGYAVNVEPPGHWRDIEIDPIYMALDREMETSVLPPQSTHIAYWKVKVPLTVSVVDMSSGDLVDRQDIAVGTLITSRYPLLESLTGEYERRLNGTSAVMTEATAFAMAYTWTRGYLQYYRPDGPKNIVSNEHLALIVNGALLLDQGFMFNSVDPASIIEYALQTRRTVTKEDDIDTAELLSGMDMSNGSLSIDPGADAANSTGDPQRASEAADAARHFDYNATPALDLLNDDSLPGGSMVSARIDSVIPQVYRAALATGVARQSIVVYGDHAGYEASHRTWDWGEPDSMEQVGTVPRDTYVPGNLYGEIWVVSWTRDHVWRHYFTVYYPCKKTRTYTCTGPDGNLTTCTEEYWDTCSTVKHTEMTAIDTRTDRVTIAVKAKENSQTSIPLRYSGTTLSTKNDIGKAFTARDVMYEGSHTDPGLEDAYNRYKRDTFDPSKEAYIRNMDMNGDSYDLRVLSVTPPSWLSDEAGYAVDEITNSIRADIHLDPSINYENYPDPADAMRAAALDLTSKIEAKRRTYIDKARYTSGGPYSSTSAKAICQVREWYVDEVLYQVRKQYLDAADRIDDQIDDNFQDSADDVRDANKKGSDLLKGVLSLPIGLTMKAVHARPDGTRYSRSDIAFWEENLTLGVNMEPDYLYEEPAGGKKLINLGVQNVCLFGPTGIPVLPPPNYVVQFNAWAINVEGRIDEFVLTDADNEVHPNPVFGHEAQVYRRTDYAIEDPSNDYIRIGYNEPIEFRFSTGTFIAVPPAGRPIGDRLGGITETSSEYGKILGK